MCARFTLHAESRLIAERFLLAQIPALVARYNIAPSQPLPVVGTKAGGHGRGLAMFRWGFIPHWAQGEKGMRPVNAKSETVASASPWRPALPGGARSSFGYSTQGYQTRDVQ